MQRAVKNLEIKSRGEVRGEVKNEENCKEFESETCGRSEIEDVDQTRAVHYEQSEDKEILNGCLHTAPSQNEFQSNYERGRPTRATQKPSRFRDEEFGT